MKPYQTIILIFAIAAFAFLRYLHSRQPDPRIERLANCYVELAILHKQADTTSARFVIQRDSVLNTLGLTEQSVREMKAQLDKEPEKLIDLWDLVEKKLKARKEALDIVKQ